MGKTLLSLVLSGLVLAACVTAPPPASPPQQPNYAQNFSPPPPPPPLTADWDRAPNTAGWTYFLQQSLMAPQGAALLAARPDDVTAFCPNFAGLNPYGRLQFWVTFMSAMAHEESGFKPAIRYDEPGLPEDSIGIMQLSLSDARIYGCAFATEKDIEDPARNLDCGVRILSSLVPSAGHIGGDTNKTGAARYFGTLRTDSAGHLRARAYIISKARLSGGCLGQG